MLAELIAAVKSKKRTRLHFARHCSAQGSLRSHISQATACRPPGLEGLRGIGPQSYSISEFALCIFLPLRIQIDSIWMSDSKVPLM